MIDATVKAPGTFEGIASVSTFANPVDVSRYATAGGYDAAESSHTRKSRAHTPKSEDAILTRDKRQRVATTAHDLVRNFELAGWLIRRHLDYVCDADFHPRTGNRAFDERLTEFVQDELLEPERCEITEQNDLDDLCRLVEAHALKDGDHLIVQTNLGKAQLVEFDLIRDPEDLAQRERAGERWIQGVRVNRNLAHTGYCVWKRDKHGRGYEEPRTVTPRFATLYAGRSRANQTRGSSPLAAALIRTQDLYESMGYALDTAKLHNQLGLIIQSAATEGFGNHTNEGDADEPKYSVSFGKSGPWKLELDPGDQASLLQSTSPSFQFQEYTQLNVRVVLLALDLPFSFFDSSKANFFGNKSELYHYLRGCRHKRKRVRRLRDRLTAWKLSRAIAEGSLRVPRGVNLSRRSWQWTPVGVPWWNPSAEMKADIDAIRSGFDNPIDVTLKRDGGDVFRNLEKTAEVIERARELGVLLAYDNAPVAPPVAPEDSGAEIDIQRTESD